MKYFGPSLDHKVIGVQYTATSILLLGIGGFFALIFRTELAESGLQVLTRYFEIVDPGAGAEAIRVQALNLYNTLMSLHGILMIVSILLGIAGVMNYLVPLLIGAEDMAFPRLNAFSFWIAPPAAVILLSSLALGGFDTGWTGYPPLSARAPVGMQMFFLGVFVAGWSSILGALNLIVTVLRLRAKGMTAFRLPIFVWAAVATSMISLTATQLIGLSFQLGDVAATVRDGVLRSTKGRQSDLVPALCSGSIHTRRFTCSCFPGWGSSLSCCQCLHENLCSVIRWVAMSSLGIALVGFLVWAHHMFTSGMNEYLRVPFMYSTLLVAVPTGVKFFSWVATLWKGKIETPTPMLFVLGGLVAFLIGGLTGPPNATVSTDLHLHDTYFIVGHFHDTMFGGYIFPFFAALYYWYPKVTGRRMNEKLGKLHFWLMTPSFMMLTLLMMRVGLVGNAPQDCGLRCCALGFDLSHLLMTIFAYIIFHSR